MKVVVVIVVAVMETAVEMGIAVVMTVRAAAVMIAKETAVIAVDVMIVVATVLEVIVNLVIKEKVLNHTLKTNMI